MPLYSFGSGGATMGGKYGIADSDGLLTYYSTLASAIAGASAGQTIEVFADVTESAGSLISITKDLTINGNGHTITIDDVSANYLLIQGSGVEVYINDLTVNRINGSSAFGVRLNTSAKLFGNNNAWFQSDSESGLEVNGGSIAYNCGSRNNSAFTCIIVDGVGSEIYDCYGENLSTGSGINLTESTARAVNCVGIGNYGILVSDGVLQNCSGYGNTNNGIRVTGVGRISNSYGESDVASGIYLDGVVTIDNTKGYSTGSKGIECDNASADIVKMISCIGESTVSYGLDVGNFSAKTTAIDCTFISSAQAGAFVNNDTDLIDCYIESTWNNASGHGVIVRTDSLIVSNCQIKVANASAFCLEANASRTIKYLKNTFEGATTSVDTDITQGQTNTEDTEGNIIIG